MTIENNLPGQFSIGLLGDGNSWHGGNNTLDHDTIAKDLLHNTVLDHVQKGTLEKHGRSTRSV